jgi:hypothetical protein
MSLHRVPASILALALGAAGMACVRRPPAETYTSESHLRDQWLPRLEDGATQRDDVIAHLGEPTVSFQERRILAYRLLLVDSYFPLAPRAYGDLLGGGPWADSRVGTDARRKGLWLAVAREARDDRRLLWELSREAEYCLVLLFDAGGTLRRHRITRVLP